MIGGWALPWRLARRELRGGLSGFRVFLICLALGVAAIAAVGTLRAAIQRGLDSQGAVILGGDAQLEFTYRFASPEERAWMDANARAVAEVVDFRSMAVAGPEGQEDRALTQVKGVDGDYPLVGDVALQPAIPLAEALAVQDGRPGGVMDGLLADRLGLGIGDVFRLGEQEFRLGARLLREPDSAGGGFAFGPRTLVATTALAGSGLLAPGTLYETEYRMLLREGQGLNALRAAARAEFGDNARWQDSRRAAPGIDQFVDRIGSFLVLVGLAGLAVGGVGVSSAVRAYLEGKTETIATLRTLGADRRMVLRTYLLQVGVLTGLGIAVGLVLGGGVPLLLAPVISAQLPFPAEFAVTPGALGEAALYGVLTAAVFALWPLARTEAVRAAALYRGAGGDGLPPAWALVATGLCAVALIGAAAWFSGVPWLALGAAAGVTGALAILAGAGLALRAGARRLARTGVSRGRVGLRLALASLGGPRAETLPIVLSLGLGLSVLAAVGQIDASLRQAIAQDLPERAPSFFFLDIQPDQIENFRNRVQADPAVSRMEAAPMLRGVIGSINGVPASDLPEHWVLRGDRGVTYSDTPGAARVTAGAWWPPGYDGPPQISFAAEEAEEIGLKLGDRISVNILGRDIEGEVTSFRTVDFSTAGMGFVMAMNPAAVQGAPHTWIATVYAEDPDAEAAILRDIGRQMPNVTAIAVKEAVGRVTEALNAIAAATAWAAAATLVTGFAVLIGAAAAGERARTYEAAVMKVLGQTRGRILASFALRAALTGAAAGAVALAAGTLAAWAVMVFVMDGRFVFAPASAAAVILGGVALTLAAGLAFAWRPLAARPAQVLRAAD